MYGAKKINFNSAGFTLVELVVAIAVIAILAGLISQGSFTTIKTDGKTEYMYSGITCSGTDDYDCYQINFSNNGNGGLTITANAKKGGKKGTDATEAFCSDTGLTAKSGQNLIDW